MTYEKIFFERAEFFLFRSRGCGDVPENFCQSLFGHACVVPEFVRDLNLEVQFGYDEPDREERNFFGSGNLIDCGKSFFRVPPVHRRTVR